MELARRELAGLPRGDVDHPEASPGVGLGRRPGVVLLLLAAPALLALRLAGEEGDRLPVRRPLEVRHGARGLGERHRLAAVRPDQPDLALGLARVVPLGARPRPLGEERHEAAVGRPARRVVAHGGGGEGARLAARGGDEPDVRLVGVLLAVQRLDDVGHEPPVGRHLRVGHDPQAEDVVARPRPIAGDGDRREGGEKRSEKCQSACHSGPPGERGGASIVRSRPRALVTSPARGYAPRGRCGSCTWRTGGPIEGAPTPGSRESSRGSRWTTRCGWWWERTTVLSRRPARWTSARASRRARPSAVDLDDLAGRLRARRRARPQRGEPGRPRVGRGPAARGAHRAGPPVLLPDAGQVDARRRGLPAPDDARPVRRLLRGPGLLPRRPRAHGAAAPRGPAAADHRPVALHARGAGGRGRAGRSRARRPALRPRPRRGRQRERPALRPLRGAPRRGEGRARRGRGVAPLRCRPAPGGGGDGAAARAARGLGRRERRARDRGARLGRPRAPLAASTAGRGRSSCRRGGRSRSASSGSRP